MKCTHPDHVEGKSCSDRAVGCHPDCRCCIPVPPNYLGMKVRKKSGKPFKSGKKSAIVSGIVQKEIPSGTLTGSTPHHPVRKMVIKDFYTFSTEEEGYSVDVFQCEENK